MSYRGHIEKGRVIVDDPVELPEGAEVKIDLVHEKIEIELHPDIVRFSGIVPEDLDAGDEYYRNRIRKHQ